MSLTKSIVYDRVGVALFLFLMPLNMRYDLLYILPLKGEEAPTQDVKMKIGELLKGMNATIVREEEPGKKKISYPMQRARYGFYGNVVFETDPSSVVTLREALQLETGILRFQIVQEEQTALRKQKTARVRMKRPSIIPTAVPMPLTPAAPKPAGEKVDLEALDKKLEELLSDTVA